MQTKDLTAHWLVSLVFLLVIIAYNLICHIWPEWWRQPIPEADRVLLRSIFYTVTIFWFPLIKLLRHILLRLNQTMPGNKPARLRYLQTVFVTTLLIEIVGVFGWLMFVLGDGFNTLYIFDCLAVLGLFLHKPDGLEYYSVCVALNERSVDD